MADHGIAITGTTTQVKEIESTSLGEAIGGIGAVVLSILGLVGIQPMLFAPIAAIILGVAFMVGGAAIAMQYSRFLNDVDVTFSRHATRGTVGMEVITGISAIVLGILALLKIDPITLMCVSAIVLGAGLLMSGSAMNSFERLGQTERETGLLMSGSDVLIGLGAIVLGILALLGNSPITLTYVALLAVGAAVLLSGSWLTARLFGIFG